MPRFRIVVYTFVLCLTAQSFVVPAHAEAQSSKVDHAAVLAPFVNDDTFAVAYANIGTFSLPADRSELLNPIVLGAIAKMPEPQQSEAMALLMVQGFASRFLEAGGKDLYLLGGVGDVYLGGSPVAIARAKEGRSLEEIQKLFQLMIREIVDDKSQLVLRPIAEQLDTKISNGAVILGTKSIVARYAGLKSAPRPDLIEPLVKLADDGALVATLFCPGADFRRVVRELWPELPGLLAPLRGELADRWLYLEAAINPLPDPKPRIVLQAKDSDSAHTFAKLLRDLPVAIDELNELGEGRAAVGQILQTIVDVAPPVQEGSRVTINFPTDVKQLSQLQQVLNGMVASASAAGRQRQKVAKFHNLALGFLNFQSAKKNFPPAAICDKEGRPLLSWRVAILPYLDQIELYKQFHLDEPWDSPHNRPLIAKMPDIYEDTDPSLRQIASAGKTTFQVPTGSDVIFHDNTAISYREIPDGTSKTILLVEVEPERAVEWTRPEDWQVDMSHPRRGIENKARKRFVVASADGDSRTLSTNIDEEKLRALLTRGGREVVDWP